ncbi:MAG: DNA mismatch repair protein MutS [Candidatus Eremiobacteraeota bacterium]|nr:DNA mismatch repair protein MutS [Candidatus Eremiobacteraeota bacterium]
MPTPSEIYAQRQAQRTRLAEQLDSSHRRIAWMRLLVALIVLTGAVAYPGAWLILPVLLFLALMRHHAGLSARRERARRAADYYREGLLRLGGEWAGRGVTSQFVEAQHPYARDLDLFGKGSLYDWLCRARTRAGQQRLADWLARPASAEEVAARQQAARELQSRLDLREDLSALQGSRQHLKGNSPQEWARQPLQLRSGWLRLLGAALGLWGWLALAYWIFRYNPLPLGLVLVVQQAFLRLAGRTAGEVLRRTESIRGECLILGAYLRRLEVEKVESEYLSQLWQPLRKGPARALSRLESVLDTLESRRNPLLGPFFALSLASFQLAHEVENWRARHAQDLPGWLESLAQIEALLSFAGLAWENPDYAWPRLEAPGSGLRARQLGHPLLGAECVCNDLELTSVRLWIVSGSNMSGKSSLLRALGCNVVLAMAGAPARAREMSLEPLRVAASIQLGDSLREGISRFYAEILRLRQVLEEASGPTRLLYLLDEILGGTNSQDRLVGARAVIRRLFELQGLGLVTTHDLALTELADELGPAAANVHFEDQWSEGVMSFDYHLRSGVIARSNALELMRAVGLQV